ncbi:MAG: S8 family serine peptidase [bacterium]
MKILKYQLIYLLYIFALLPNLKSQNYHDTIAWITVNDSELWATDGDIFSKRDLLNNILTNKNVVYYEQALPFARNPDLLKIHEVRLENGGSVDDLFYELKSTYPVGFENLSKFEIHEGKRQVYEPTDHMWTIDWLWYLEKIQAEYAWDITKGDPNIKIAVIDGKPDITHPDLVDEIIFDHDPYDNTLYGCDGGSYGSHGTMVAGFASAQTTEQNEIADPNAQLASIGFNTKIISYSTTNSPQLNLQKALHASNVMGASVVVSCAGVVL